MHYNLLCQANYKCFIVSLVVFNQELFEHSPKDILVDAHKKILDITLQNPTISCEVIGNLAYLFVYAFNCVCRALSFTTIVAVFNKVGFKQVYCPIDYIVVRNPIPKISRKHLSQFRPCYNKRCAITYLIRSVV